VRKFNTPLLLLGGLVLLFQSCISYESMVNFQESRGAKLTYNEPVPIRNPNNIRVQVNDVLDIKIHSQDIATAAPFNLIPAETVGSVNDPNLYQLYGYLVDEAGNIDFPVLGKLHLLGKTKEEAKQLIFRKLESYLKNPVVNIRFLNFKITVSGEVNRSGVFSVYNERVTLSEIITMAGDLTPYADRTNILVVREVNGNRTFARVDMSSSNFFASDYYFLQQNDFIYIEPLEAKRGAVRDNSSKVLPFVSAFVSIAALIISVVR